MEKPLTTTKTDFELNGATPTIDTLIKALNSIKKETKDGSMHIMFWHISIEDNKKVEKELVLNSVLYDAALGTISFDLKQNDN